MGVKTKQLNSNKSVKERTKDELRNLKDDYCFKITNIVVLCIFITVLTGWLIMNCIYLQRGCIFHSIIQDEFFINITNMNNQIIASLPIIRQNDIGLIIWLVLSGTTVFLFLLKTLNNFPKFWAIIGLIVEALIVILSVLYIFLSIFAFFFFQNAFSAYYLQFVIIIICGLALSPVCTKNFDPIIESLKKTSHVTFSFPSVFLFGFIAAMLMVTVSAFTAVSFYSTDSTASSVICLIGGIYLVSVIFNFVIEVISECVNILNGSQNKEGKSRCLVLKGISLAVRKDSGFIILWCTFIVPLIIALFICCSQKNKQRSKAQLRAELVHSWLTYNGMDYIIPLIASHPAGVEEATKKIFNLIFIRRCGINTTFAAIFGAVLFVFCAMGMIIAVGVPFAIFYYSSVGTKTFIQIAVVYTGLGIVLLFGVVFATVNIAGSVNEYIVGKEVVKSVKREMSHNEDKSVNCAIDQTQEPKSITVV